MDATDDIPSDHSKVRRIRLPSPGILLVGTLLLIGCAVAIPIGMRYQRQQELIEYIELQGGSVEMEDYAPAWVHGLLVSVLGEDQSRGFSEIVGVTLMSDGAIPRLSGTTSIRYVSINEWPDAWPDTGSAHLNLQPLSQFHNLVELDLSFTFNVGNDDMRHLSGLTNLRIFNLRFTEVGDEGLQYLSGLENLEALDLRDTHCSADGVEELRSHLPNCEINDGSTFRGRRRRNCLY